MKHLFRTAFLPVILIPSLVVSPLWAETSGALASLPVTGSGSGNLELRVVNADGSATAGTSRTSQALTVEVRDTNGGAVSDAAVAFRLPDTGLSGVFGDGSHSAVAYTDAAGIAHVDGIRWNAITGSASIRITATKGNSHAGMLVERPMAETAVRTPELTVQSPVIAAPAAPNRREPGVLAATDAAEANTIQSSSEALASASVKPHLPATAAIVPGMGGAIRPAGQPSVSIVNKSSSGSPRSNSLLPEADPSVSISSSPGEYSSHSGMKKWLIWAAVAAAGAGAGIAFAGKGGTASTSSSSSSVTVGAPSISIGH